MIKVKVHLDGNQFGYTEYACKESLEDYYDCIKQAVDVDVVALTEIDTGALITIPIYKYVVEAWEVDE